MPERIIKTNTAILNELNSLLAEQKKLIELFRATRNKDYLDEFEDVSHLFHELREKLIDPEIKDLRDADGLTSI